MSAEGPCMRETPLLSDSQSPTIDDINPALPEDPKLWELWYIPYYG